MENRMIKRIALLLALLSPMAAHADPVTAAVAWAAATFAVTTATVYLVAATVILSTGMAIYGSAQARRAERDAQNARNASMQDRMATRIASESPHRYIYGEARVGSDIVAMFNSGDKDQYKHIVCVLAAHECEAVEEVYINNVAVGLSSVTAEGDITGGRYVRDPDTNVIDEPHIGPSFTLSKMPIAGSVSAYVGYGADMQEVAVTSFSGRNVTVDYTGSVLVSYEIPMMRRFGDAVDDTAAVSQIPYVRVQVHLGGATDPADAYLMSVVPDKWASTAVLRGLTYLVVTLDLNSPEFQNGQVPIQALVRGRKLYDPRTGLTAWSSNPALCIYDYLTSPLCGVPASDLPVAQYITAANACDEVIGWFSSARYTLNGTVTSDQSQSSVLEAMAECMGGGIVSTSWDIYAGKYVAPVAALTQGDIVGSIAITPGVSDAAIYNGVKGQFLSAENGYVLTDFKPYQNDVYRANDGRDLYTNIDFPFTNNSQRVTNLARIFTEDQRNGFTLKAEFSLKAWSLKAGQRITFTSAYLGQTAKIYRITDKSYAPNSAVELTLKEDDPSIWDLADAVTLDSTPNTDLPDPWAIAPLASLTCTSGVATLLRQADGSIIPRILVSWPAATTQSVFTNGEIEIEWRAISTDTWQKTKVTGSDTEAYISPITPGFFYVVRSRTVNPYLNTKSNWVTTTYQVEVFNASPVAYKWSATQPAIPSVAGAYSWATSSFSAPSGWSLTIPAAPGGGNSSLWAATAFVSDIDASGSTTFDWGTSSVAAIGYSPSAAGVGPAGYSNARVYAYQRSASAPTGTPGAVDYDFATGTITTATLANGWQKTMPTANGNPMYITAASASAAGTTDSIASGEWSGAVVWAYDGGAGTPGLNNATVTIYHRAASATAPTLPSAAATYTFATGALTGLNNGWTPYIPSSGGAYLHTSLATAAATTATDSIAAGEWAAVTLMYDAAAVIAAQAAADAANTAISNITANGILDMSEKPEVIQKWAVIQAEFNPLQVQADSLAVGHSTYDAAYVALFNYLDSLNTAPAWTNVAVDTPITRTTFNSKFTDYYSAKIVLMNAIVAKSAFAPSAVIGGRNLYPDSGFERGTHPCTSRNAISSVQINSTLGGNGAPYSGSAALWFDTTGGDAYLLLGGPTATVSPGKQYVLSFMYMCATNVGITASSSYMRLSDGTYVAIPLPNLSTGSVWTKGEVAWTCPAGVTWMEFRAGIICGSGYSWMAVDCIQLEEGNKRTQWMPAPEDMTLAGQGYTGALDATKGAPSGTNVAGVLADTLVTQAAAGNTANTTLNTPPVINGISDVYASVYKPVVTVATIYPSVTGGVGPFRFDWSTVRVNTGDAVVSYVISTVSSPNDKLVVKGICQISGGTETLDLVTCTTTDSKGRTSTTQFYVGVSG